jgi:DNA-binding phage protein
METSAEQVEKESHEEARRLVEVLRVLSRMLGYRNRDLERRAKLNHATSVRVFAGDSEPRLQFLLAVVKALGLEYWEFFELAYADRPASSSEAPLAAGILEPRPHPGKEGRAAAGRAETGRRKDARGSAQRGTEPLRGAGQSRRPERSAAEADRAAQGAGRKKESGLRPPREHPVTRACAE